VTYPPSGPPGHIPGYHLHGTLIPIAAIALSRPEPDDAPAAAAPPPIAPYTLIRDDRFNGHWTSCTPGPEIPQAYPPRPRPCGPSPAAAGHIVDDH
jgi:hypothetical protein